MILVTGGTGFVGRRLVRLLVEAHGAESILCLAYDQADNELERSGRANLEALGVKYIPVDLVSGRGLDQVPRAPKVVLHLASCTDTSAYDHSINDVGARNLYEAIRPLNPDAHFIFTSTIAVSDHRQNPAEPVSEETPLLTPFNEYGRKKLLTEAYLKARCREDKFCLSIVRLCAIYGSGTRINGLYDQLHRLTEKGSLVGRLNFPGMMGVICVDDIANVLVTLTQKGRPPAGEPELYIPVHECIDTAGMLERIHQAMGKPYQQIRLPAFFWKTCDFFAQLAYRLEPVIPHKLYNFIWQMGILVNTGFHNKSEKAQRVLGLKFKDFLAVAREVVKVRAAEKSRS